jgi:tripartite-type tricarboxylate transporter receptor subunit TctC
LRVLAVTGPKRSTLFPQLPTVKESGLPGYEFDSWFGLLAPAGTPAAVVERLNQAVNKIVAMPEVADRLRKLGIESNALNVAGFNKVFLDDHDQMVKLVKDIGLTRES